MSKQPRPIRLLTVLALVTMLLPAAARSEAAGPGGNNIVYNLYATDGYVTLADAGQYQSTFPDPGVTAALSAAGVPIGANQMATVSSSPMYIYGFVGGRADAPLTYLQSADPNRPFAEQVTGSIPVGSPYATPGVTMGADEAKLAHNAQLPGPVIYGAVGDVVEIRLKNLGVDWVMAGAQAAKNPNTPNDPHSIHLHGTDVDAGNDGVPETSLGAVPANEVQRDANGSPVSRSACGGWANGLCTGPLVPTTSFADMIPLPAAGNIVVYMLSPTRTGTYMYHCHQEASVHVDMQMYGALVVYDRNDPAYGGGKPGGGPGTGGGNLWGFNYTKDTIMLLGDTDLRQHMSEQSFGPYAPNAPLGPGTFNPSDYHPQYWFVNGLSFPATIHTDVSIAPTYTLWDMTNPASPAPLLAATNLPLTGGALGALGGGANCGAAGCTLQKWSNWLTAHRGYDPFIQGSVSAGDKVLLRMINMGFETQPLHMHGFHAKVLGSDQRPWPWANRPWTKVGDGLEKNTITIGSGETYDLLFDFSVWKNNSAGQYAATGGASGQPGTYSRYNPLPGADNGPAVNTSAAPAMMDPFTSATLGIFAPYIGGPAVTGTVIGDVSSPAGQYFPFHNHDDYKASNWGVYPGGQFTMIKTLP